MIRHPLAVSALLTLLTLLGAPVAQAAPDGPATARTERAPQKRITLDLHEAELHNVLRLFAEVSGRNLVVPDDVQGKVTIRLKDVPWDEALEVILKTRGLGLAFEDGILRVAPQATLDAEARRSLELARLHDEKAPLRTRMIPVNYAKAKDLVPLVKGVLSARGTVSHDERTNTLIVQDVADSEVFRRF